MSEQTVAQRRAGSRGIAWFFVANFDFNAQNVHSSPSELFEELIEHRQQYQESSLKSIDIFSFSYSRNKSMTLPGTITFTGFIHSLPHSAILHSSLRAWFDNVPSFKIEWTRIDGPYRDNEIVKQFLAQSVFEKDAQQQQHISTPNIRVDHFGNSTSEPNKGGAGKHRKSPAPVDAVGAPVAHAARSEAGPYVSGGRGRGGRGRGGRHRGGAGMEVPAFDSAGGSAAGAGAAGGASANGAPPSPFGRGLPPRPPGGGCLPGMPSSSPGGSRGGGAGAERAAVAGDGGTAATAAAAGAGAAGARMGAAGGAAADAGPLLGGDSQISPPRGNRPHAIPRRGMASGSAAAATVGGRRLRRAADGDAEAAAALGAGAAGGPATDAPPAPARGGAGPPESPSSFPRLYFDSWLQDDDWPRHDHAPPPNLPHHYHHHHHHHHHYYHHRHEAGIRLPLFWLQRKHWAEREPAGDSSSTAQSPSLAATMGGQAGQG